ncbi:DUF2306 domain-containing protein [Agrilutibacter solisilvae]|uniref:DUF2306 domain-containing protein n=1 Tax=Agrilutibacter solisilvae TaxID=2763317 RepID=A0A974Y1B7_9GAMM|nr:DUF2306 domain-containing protein [Lysobacter solisilvae]QSX79423.1 DUF2306 domain-containing protein [Lysobacter solisilvae]
MAGGLHAVARRLAASAELPAPEHSDANAASTASEPENAMQPSSPTADATPGLLSATPARAGRVVDAEAGNRAARTLRLVAAVWFGVAATGQLIFVAYILGLYGLSALRGDLAAWNAVMPRAYVPGATFANTVIGVHLAFAAIVVTGGIFQLVPAVRRRWPVFHRWNGRVYLSAIFLVCTAGLIMFATREIVGDPEQRVASVINVALILVFAVQALRHARARRIDIHRRWALRLFLAASAAWVFRVALMFWIVVNQGPVGFDPKTFQGPFLIFLAFAQYLLPLGVLELYFLARDRGGARVRYAMSAGLGLATLATATGIGAATMILWWPKL